jgi:hypothetical protein
VLDAIVLSDDEEECVAASGPLCTETARVASDGRPSYLNAEKVGIRAMFAAACRNDTMVYLDDCSMGYEHSATNYFKSIGYKDTTLVPVNREPAQCLVLSKATGTLCQARQLREALEDIQDASVGGTWMDYNTYRIDTEDVRHALRVSKYVVVLTLSSRRNDSNLNNLYTLLCSKSEQFAHNTKNQVLGLDVHGQWQCTSTQVYGAMNESRSLDMVNLQFQRRCVVNSPPFVQHISAPVSVPLEDYTEQLASKIDRSELCVGCKVLSICNEPRRGTIVNRESKSWWSVQWECDPATQWIKDTLPELMHERDLRSKSLYCVTPPLDALEYSRIHNRARSCAPRRCVSTKRLIPA